MEELKTAIQDAMAHVPIIDPTRRIILAGWKERKRSGNERNPNLYLLHFLEILGLRCFGHVFFALLDSSEAS